MASAVSGCATGAHSSTLIQLQLAEYERPAEPAESAEDGLLRYKEVTPDLVIVDLMMEEVDAGTNFVKDVRALGNPPPIYMLSSVGDNLNLSTDYSALGLSGVLQKPVNPAQRPL